jgi:hypothetical protein
MRNLKNQEIENTELVFWQYLAFLTEQLLDKAVEKTWPGLTCKDILKAASFNGSTLATPSPNAPFQILKDFSSFESCLKTNHLDVAFSFGMRLFICFAFKLCLGLTERRITSLPVATSPAENKTQKKVSSFMRWSKVLVLPMVEALANPSPLIQDPIKILSSLAKRKLAELKTAGVTTPAVPSTAPLKTKENKSTAVKTVSQPVIQERSRFLSTLTLKKTDFLPEYLASLTKKDRSESKQYHATSLGRMSQAVVRYTPSQLTAQESKEVLSIQQLQQILRGDVFDQMLEYEQQEIGTVNDDLLAHENFLHTVFSSRLKNVKLNFNRIRNSLVSAANTVNFITSYERFFVLPEGSGKSSAFKGFELYAPIRYSVQLTFPYIGLELRPQVDFTLEVSMVDAHYFGISAVLAPASPAKALLESYIQQMVTLPTIAFMKVAKTGGQYFPDAEQELPNSTSAHSSSSSVSTSNAVKLPVNMASIQQIPPAPSDRSARGPAMFDQPSLAPAQQSVSEAVALTDAMLKEDGGLGIKK